MATFECHRESALRKQADPPTIRMLEQWQLLCREKVGTMIEVVFVNRREYPFHGINTHIGEMNTAIPQPFEDRLILLLLLEDTKKLDMLIVTHEIGHWFLNLQGLKVIENKNDNSYDYLSSLCSHPALYKLQRSFGHEPQKEIDRRAAHNIAMLGYKTETADEKTNIKSALQYTDDLLNCSRSNRIGLERKISNKLPRTAEIIEIILKLKNSRDLSKIEEVLPFSKEVVQKLGLEGNWSESNDLNQLKKDIAKLKR